ncbi:MAG: peptidoglycan DD-metalloendopeptidase family protein [Solirubrobacteraceae bacterium]
MRRYVAGLLALSTIGALAPAVQGSSLGSKLAAKQAREHRLRSQVASESHRIGLVQGSINQVQRRLGSVEADLSAKQARLNRIQDSLRQARKHLVRLQVQLAAADKALAANLISQYESDPPDAVTVILNSHGFADLMDRLEFVRRAKEHDKQVIQADQKARVTVIAAANQLGDLERRQETLTSAIQQRRDDIDRIRIRLVDRRIRIERARSAKSASLTQARAERQRLEHQLARINARKASAGASGSGSVSAGSVLRGGGVVFPMPGGAASPPGTWTNDQGVDISAAGNTPLLAMGSGTIVLHGIGGFGPSAPVLHLDDGRYIYYGHAGPGNMVPVGARVHAGQVISEVGAGIVGISTGPHLEIGFSDAAGTPIGPGTAPTMHAMLLSAYHG